MSRAPPHEILRPVRGAYIALTLLTALVFNLLALPDALAQVRPDLIALTLIYWVVYHPRRIGFLPAWFLGLTMDVADGSLFGQHALAYAVLMYLAILLHRRILMFGMRQQIVHVAAILLLSQFIMLGVRMLSGADFPGPLFFLPSFAGALLWPLLFNVIRIPLRPRTDANAV
jgi:rod shape-determining protein MreD